MSASRPSREASSEGGAWAPSGTIYSALLDRLYRFSLLSLLEVVRQEAPRWPEVKPDECTIVANDRGSVNVLYETVDSEDGHFCRRRLQVRAIYIVGAFEGNFDE